MMIVKETLIEEHSMSLNNQKPWLFDATIKKCPLCNNKHRATLTTNQEEYFCFDKRQFVSVFTGRKIIY